MSWDGYIQSLTSPDKNNTVPVKEAAIWGTEPVGMWAKTKGLEGIKPEEVQRLIGDRSSFRSSGPFIAGTKCMLLRDQLDMDGIYSLDLKTKADADGNTYPICVGRSHKALVIAMGFKDTSGGALLDKVFNIVKYLRENKM